MADKSKDMTPEHKEDADRQAHALRRAHLFAVLAGGASAVVGTLGLPTLFRLAAVCVLSCTLLGVWYVQFRPRVRSIVHLSAAQWVGVGASFAIAAGALSALLLSQGRSSSYESVHQERTSILARSQAGGYLIGAAGSADGIPGVIVLRVKRDGSLDPTFGRGGVAFHRVGVGHASVDSIAATGDGGVLVAGMETSPNGGPAAFLGQLLPDGAANPDFFGEFSADRHSKSLVVRQTPSRLLLGVTSRLGAGNTEVVNGHLQTRNTYDVVRLTNGAKVDPSYGRRGYAVGPIECGRVMRIPCQPVRALVLRDDGGVVLASSLISVVSRQGQRSLTSRGVVLGAGGGWTSLATDAEGRILAAGAEAAGAYAEPEFVVARFQDGNAFDVRFGERGQAKIDLPADQSEVGGILPMADGTIVVAGRAATYGRDGVALARLKSNGSLDRSFGSGGVVILHPLHDRRPLTRRASTAIIDESDGRILVAETLAPRRNETTGGLVALARLKPNGRLDRSFGTGGVATWSLDFPSSEAVKAGDVFLGGLHQSRVIRAGDLRYVPLRTLCYATDAPSFTCSRLSRDNHIKVAVRLSASGGPVVIRNPIPSCCAVSRSRWRQAEPLAQGNETWLRTKRGAFHCVALTSELVCGNSFRHGFALTRSAIKTW